MLTGSRGHLELGPLILGAVLCLWCELHETHSQRPPIRPRPDAPIAQGTREDALTIDMPALVVPLSATRKTMDCVIPWVTPLRIEGHLTPFGGPYRDERDAYVAIQKIADREERARLERLEKKQRAAAAARYASEHRMQLR